MYVVAGALLNPRASLECDLASGLSCFSPTQLLCWTFLRCRIRRDCHHLGQLQQRKCRLGDVGCGVNAARADCLGCGADLHLRTHMLCTHLQAHAIEPDSDKSKYLGRRSCQWWPGVRRLATAHPYHENHEEIEGEPANNGRVEDREIMCAFGAV